MKSKTNAKGCGGQAILEFILCLGVFLVMLLGMISIFEVVNIRHKVFEAARLGASLQSTGFVADSVVQMEMENYFKQLHSHSMIESSWKLGRFLETPSSYFYTLVAAKVEVRVRNKFLNKAGLPEIKFSEKVVMVKNDGG